MPYKPRKPCSYAGCPEFVDSGHQFCLKHIRIEQKRYDQQRGSSTQRGYDSRWRKYTKHYIAKNPLCVNFDECGNAATLVDHIILVNQGGDFWNPANHQPMCGNCHNVKRATEDKKGRGGG